ncbi:hypothetical protein [Streptomyces sp. SYSU K21746]
MDDVEEATRAELDNLRVEQVSPGLAAVAVRLAKALDAIPADDAPTSQAVVADKLTAVMTKLRALAPIGEEGDAVDELTAQRAKRRAEAQERLG